MIVSIFTYRAIVYAQILGYFVSVTTGYGLLGFAAPGVWVYLV